jgi:hypothetical protein
MLVSHVKDIKRVPYAARVYLDDDDAADHYDCGSAGKRTVSFPHLDAGFFIWDKQQLHLRTYIYISLP